LTKEGNLGLRERGTGSAKNGGEKGETRRLNGKKRFRRRGKKPSEDFPQGGVPAFRLDTQGGLNEKKAAKITYLIKKGALEWTLGKKPRRLRERGPPLLGEKGVMG